MTLMLTGYLSTPQPGGFTPSAVWLSSPDCKIPNCDEAGPGCIELNSADACESVQGEDGSVIALLNNLHINDGKFSEKSEEGDRIIRLIEQGGYSISNILSDYDTDVDFEVTSAKLTYEDPKSGQRKTYDFPEEALGDVISYVADEMYAMPEEGDER